MDTSQLLVGDSAAFNFLPPYDGILSNKNIYRVESLSSISSLVERGINPKENIYALYDIMNDYDSDLVNDMIIVELSLSSRMFYIPLNKIVSKNNEPQIAYSERMIGIKLGFIPDNEDITSILSDIDLLIKARLGITSDDKSHIADKVVSAKVVIAESQHIDYENSRNSLKTESGNYMTLYYNLQDRHQEVITKLQSLETAYLNGAYDT